MQQYVHPLIQFLHFHPHAAGLITFAIVFLETLAVVGMIVPGTILMTAIGALIGSNVISAGSTFICAIAGAAVGDFLSYLIGFHYKKNIHNIWPFTKYPSLLKKGEDFFAKHGGKSVVIGRIGPMRAIIPLIAGMLKMPIIKFLVAAIPSAAIWAVMYIIPGVLLGALSLELPPKVATQFILGALLALIILWSIVWLTQHFARKLYRKFDRLIKKIWLTLRRSTNFHWLTNLLADPREPNNHQQLTLVILTITVLALFSLIVHSVLINGIFTFFNGPIYHILTSLRSPRLDHLFVAITLIADSRVIVLFCGLFLLWLLYKRYWYIAAHWFVLMILGALAIQVPKYLLFVQRPEAYLLTHAHANSSFPSGHTTISTAIFGFCATIIARELSRKKRWIPYSVASIFVFFVALSRLYLGAHWLTDVIAGMLIGSAAMLILTISYRRKHVTQFSVSQFATMFISILLAIWFAYSLFTYNQKISAYTLQWPNQITSLESLQKQTSDIVPLFRLNRLGKPVEAFNINCIGDLNTIKQNFLKRGWEEQPTDLTLSGIALRLLGNSIISHLPLLPQLYHNRPPVLVMTKLNTTDNTFLLLSLWQSDITLTDIKQPFWLGTIENAKLEPKIFSMHNHFKKNKFVGATDELRPYVTNEIAKELIYLQNKQPEIMEDLRWDGKVLLLTPKEKSKHYKAKTS